MVRAEVALPVVDENVDVFFVNIFAVGDEQGDLIVWMLAEQVDGFRANSWVLGEGDAGLDVA